MARDRRMGCFPFVFLQFLDRFVYKLPENRFRRTNVDAGSVGNCTSAFLDLIAGHFRRFDRLSDTGRGHVVAHVLHKVGHRATV